MSVLRRLVLAHSHLAGLMCVVALALKLLVPSGYMIARDHGTLAIILCPGVAAQPARMDMPEGHGVMPEAQGDMSVLHAEMTDTTGDMTDHGRSREHGKAEMPCAFSSLSAQALGAIDTVLLLAAIAFAVAIALRPVRLEVPPPTAYLRPPLRGPPVFH